MDVTAGTGRLQGKQVLVTGGTTGLGFAIAERFLREGATVVVTGRDEELGSRAQAKLGDAGQIWFVAADAGDPAALARSVDVAVGHLGALDVLVNNAGIGIVAGLLRTPLEDYNRLMDVNVRGYFLYAQAAYPHLARRRGSNVAGLADPADRRDRPVAALGAVFSPGRGHVPHPRPSVSRAKHIRAHPVRTSLQRQHLPQHHHGCLRDRVQPDGLLAPNACRSEEHTSELQSP